MYALGAMKKWAPIALFRLYKLHLFREKIPKILLLSNGGWRNDDTWPESRNNWRKRQKVILFYSSLIYFIINYKLSHSTSVYEPEVEPSQYLRLLFLIIPALVLFLWTVRNDIFWKFSIKNSSLISFRYQK